MPSKSSPIVGILTSAALATLTLTIFAKNQVAGPASTVLQFLRVLEGREKLTSQAPILGNPYEISFVVEQMKDFLSNSFSYAVSDVRISGDKAAANVVFFAPRGERQMTVYLTKLDGRWVLDARNPAWRSR